MESSQKILKGSGDMEKGAYLGAIASIATADRQASPEEIEFLTKIADSAALSQEQKEAVIKAAQEITDEDAKRCLDVLKTSELKYSLVTDLIAFAKSDNNYTDDERQKIQKMAEYLGVNNQQFSLLDHFTNTVRDAAPNPLLASTSTSSATATEEPEQPDFLSSLGLKDKLQSAGINGSSLLKGLLGIAAPMLLANMVAGGFNRNRGMFGGGSSLLGGGLLGGGLGSVFSMFGGGYQRSGGLLGRIFGGGF